ncbi:diheme cytochrome c [Ottowia testudinis]|uniref:Diheme cytochrome c n=1 Tax=Ottowia testudinis TaxID=2816950 RepID=A0A975CH40_9BURK|nr:diheme cytochrome c [Ottowia testudinis]QTD46280.1 diheme cytochrome c [Ottowia testudinis]
MRSLHVLIAAAVLSGAAHADGNGRRMPAQVPKAYTQECASCHMAYPPGLLPAASWQRMMNGLDQHYGSDASLDATTVRALSSWLLANAGTYKRVRAESAPPEDRMTKSRWFARKHDEIPAATYRRASIKSAANCMACHAGAERGDFDDDNARIPK